MWSLRWLKSNGKRNYFLCEAFFGLVIPRDGSDGILSWDSSGQILAQPPKKPAHFPLFFVGFGFPSLAFSVPPLHWGIGILFPLSILNSFEPEWAKKGRNLQRQRRSIRSERIGSQWIESRNIRTSMRSQWGGKKNRFYSKINYTNISRGSFQR